MFSLRNLLILFALLTVLQYAIVNWPSLPPTWAEYVNGLFKAVDAALVAIASRYNQDGTAAALPYVKK